MKGASGAKGLSSVKAIHSTHLFQRFVKLIQDVNQELLGILLCLFHEGRVEVAKSGPEYFWGDTVRVPQPHVRHHVGKSGGHFAAVPGGAEGAVSG